MPSPTTRRQRIYAPESRRVIAGAPFTINVKDPPSGHAALAVVGDILRMRHYDGAATLLDNWMRVTGVTDPGAGNGYFQYTVERQSGTPGAFPAGTAIVNYGQSGDGYILLSSDAVHSPYISIATHAGSPWASVTEHVRIGNLNGWGSFVADRYGWGVGDPAGSEYAYYNAVDGLIIRGTLRADDGYLGTLSIDGVLSIGASGGIYQGTGTFAAPTTGFKVWNDGGVGRIAGYNASVLQWYGSTDGKLYAGAGALVLDSTGIHITQGTGLPNSVSWDIASPGYSRISAQGSAGNPVYGQWAVRAVDANGSLVLIQAVDSVGAVGATFYVHALDRAIEAYNCDLRVAYGLYVGSLATDPDTGDVIATADGRFGGGLYVGSVATNPTTGDVIATVDGRFGGGLYVGSTATDPAADTLTVDGTIAVAKAFSDHGGYGNVVDLQGGICLNRTNDAGVLYLMASFDSGGTLMSRIYNDTSGANNTLIIRQDAASGTITLMGSNVGVGAVPAATFDVTGTVAFRAISPAQITGNTNNWNPGTGSFIRMTSNGAYNITGLVAGANGEIKTIVNIGSYTLTFINESASSTAANRFTLGGSNRAVAVCIKLQYDSTSSRWRLVSYL